MRGYGWLGPARGRDSVIKRTVPQKARREKGNGERIPLLPSPFSLLTCQLPRVDSNHHSQIQSLESCHWTTGQQPGNLSSREGDGEREAKAHIRDRESEIHHWNPQPVSLSSCGDGARLTMLGMVFTGFMR